jgi:hypothetical protein
MPFRGGITHTSIRSFKPGSGLRRADCRKRLFSFREVDPAETHIMAPPSSTSASASSGTRSKAERYASMRFDSVDDVRGEDKVNFADVLTVRGAEQSTCVCIIVFSLIANELCASTLRQRRKPGA